MDPIPPAENTSSGPAPAAGPVVTALSPTVRLWRAGTLVYTLGGLTALWCWLLLGDVGWSLKERAALPMMQMMLQLFDASNLFTGFLLGAVPAACMMLVLLVVTGGHDQPCGALGAGVTRPGVAMYATGTVDCITPAFAEPQFSEALRQNNLCTYDYVVPGLYTTVAFSLTGGNILKWFRTEFGHGQSYDELLTEIATAPTNLLVLPYWTPSGTPYFDCETPGAIVGLRLCTKRGEILRALLEGVAFEMRLNLEILEQSGCPLNELRSIGGGARSAAWNQLKAEVLGKPLTRLEISEAGCLGAAILACAADSSSCTLDRASAPAHSGT